MMRKYSSLILISLMVCCMGMTSLWAAENLFRVDFDNFDFSGHYGNQRISPRDTHTRQFVSGSKGGALNLTARPEALIYTLPFFDPAAGTVECLIKLHPDAKLDRRYIFTIYQGGEDYLMRACIDGFNKLTFQARSGASGGYTSVGGTFDADLKQNWLHFAVSWKQLDSNRTEFFVYVNGLKIGQAKMDALFQPGQANPSLVLGGWVTKNIPFIGMIDAFEISDRARYTQEYIQGATVGYNPDELQRDAETLSGQLKQLKAENEAARQLRKALDHVEKEIAELKNQTPGPEMSGRFMTLKTRMAEIERKIACQLFWQSQDTRYFAVLPVDSMVKYASDWDSVKRDDDRLRVRCAGNEYSNMQFLVIPHPEQNEKHFQVELTPFQDSTGNQAGISAELFQVDAMQLNYLSTPKACAEFLHPLENDRLSLTDELYKPLFLIFHTPAGVKAGTYTAGLTVSSGRHKITYPLTMDVYDFSLPVTPRLKTAFGFLTGLISRHYGISQDSEKFQRLKTAYLDNMLKHRVSPKSAIRGNTREDVTFLAPLAVKTAAGEWKMEFADYEKQLDELLAGGLNTIMVGDRDWVPKPAAKGRKSFYYYDEADGKYKTLVCEFMSPEMLQFGAWYIKTWYDFIKRKGLEKMAYTYVYDEPQTPEEFREITRVCDWLDTVVPGLPHMLTATPPSADYDAIDIWCPLEPVIEDNQILKAQLRKGKKLWSYVCCAPIPPAMNLLMQQRGITNRAVFWHVYKFGAEGFLYWEHAANMSPWRGKTMEDPRFMQMPDTEGDGFLIYPGPDGPVNSIRFEYVRQGMQDVDYFFMLKDLVEQLPNDNPVKKAAQKLLTVPDDIVTSVNEYSFDPNRYRNHRHKIAEMIEQIKKMNR